MSTWTLKEKSMGDMNVTIEGEEWKNAVKKAFNKIAKNAKIDGFRKGHVPAAMLEKKVSMAERQTQAIEDNANEWMRKAFEELNLTPISQPQLDVKSMDDEKAELVFTFAIMPEVELGEYKGLKYEVEAVEVTDEELNEEIDRMRRSCIHSKTPRFCFKLCKSRGKRARDRPAGVGADAGCRSLYSSAWKTPCRADQNYAS